MTFLGQLQPVSQTLIPCGGIFHQPTPFFHGVYAVYVQLHQAKMANYYTYLCETSLNFDTHETKVYFIEMD